jgi:hypothetical protein
MKNIITNNLRLAQKDNVMQSKKTLKQRALILSGGGALGAYQVRVLKTLRKRLSREEGKKAITTDSCSISLQVLLSVR